MKPVTALLKTLQTRIGIVFAIFVPFAFLIIWMTGYNGATDRIDRLHVGLVGGETNESQTAVDFFQNNAPFQTALAASQDEALADMDEGLLDMVVIVPTDLESAAASGGAKLIYYVNDRSSELVKGVMESMANQLTAQLNGVVVPDVQSLPIQAEVIKTNEISNFALSMLPMILGFIPYIAMMTMNIQFNVASNMLKRQFGKWELFFARQLVLASVAIVVPLLLSAAVKLFLDVHASFWELWGFEMLVFTACICVTQLAFALFGNAGPLFNVFLIPFQLMTAGNIIAASMLTPFYRHFGSFLPASNGIQGAMHLVYGGGSAGGYAATLALIAVVAWGLTVLRLAVPSRAAAAPKAQTAA
ncbi:YhgE/Pip domain-containing protein [Paenibacillus soyae]|uniref:ABC transporter permease n=1 Tax=Paenibacillus soyae TaxID=2969249 RepID=A0A9X2MVE6_9BACL|nr:ABC transporter permease [Paenibacillus soyae]MCR2807639.1 ABC transporter permease [Paenibacillus soyae]